MDSDATNACLGREKGACDRLQRHPLIDPIFPRGGARWSTPGVNSCSRRRTSTSSSRRGEMQPLFSAIQL